MPRPPKAKTAAKDSAATHGVETDFGAVPGTAVGRDLRPILCAESVLADPPFNDADGFLGTNEPVRLRRTVLVIEPVLAA